MLQITVGHRTLAEQNSLISDQSLSVVGHNARTLFLQKRKKEEKFSGFIHVRSRFFVSLPKGSVYIYFSKWQNSYLYSFFDSAFFAFLCPTKIVIEQDTYPLKRKKLFAALQTETQTRAVYAK